MRLNKLPGVNPSTRLPGNRSFRLLWISSLATSGAQWLERVVTSWLALQISGDAFGVGVVLAARTLPSLLLGIGAGSLADRTPRRTILLAIATLAAFTFVVASVVVGAESIVLLDVAALSFLGGCVQVFDAPSRQTLVVDIAGRENGPRAIASLALAGRLVGALGALTGGILVTSLGVPRAYDGVALSYLVGVALLLGVREPRRSTLRSSSSTALIPMMRSTIQLLARNGSVRILALTAMACEIFGFSYMTAVPSIARDILRIGADGLGLLNASAAIGATIAVALLTAGPARRLEGRRHALLATVFAMYGVAIVGLAVSPTSVIACLAMLVIGSCAATFDTLQQTLLQLAVPEDQRGRAVGIWVFSIGTAPVGHLEVGSLATLWGAPLSLTLNGLVLVIGAGTLVTLAPSFRWKRQPPTSATGDSARKAAVD